MKKPSNRKERVKFIIRKLGRGYESAFALMTDREVKGFFDELYLKIKDREDFQEERSNPKCLVCQGEVEITWDCGCGHAIIDQDDTALQDLKDSGEYYKYNKQPEQFNIQE